MGKTNAIKEKQRNTAIHLLTHITVQLRFLLHQPFWFTKCTIIIIHRSVSCLLNQAWRCVLLWRGCCPQRLLEPLQAKLYLHCVHGFGPTYRPASVQGLVNVDLPGEENKAWSLWLPVPEQDLQATVVKASRNFQSRRARIQVGHFGSHSERELHYLSEGSV